MIKIFLLVILAAFVLTCFFVGLFIVVGGILFLLVYIIPSKWLCKFGFHVTDGCYGGPDEDSNKKGMLTTCRYCGKRYYVDEPWMHIPIGGCRSRNNK